MSQKFAASLEARRALAQENPFAAIHNADSHEYFAEAR